MKTKIVKPGISLMILVCLLFFSSYEVSYAQDSSVHPSEEVAPSLFIGPGMGINHYTGLIGVNFELPLINKLSAFGTLGLGGWGYKVGGGLAFYPKQLPYGPSLSLGYSMASGMTDFETELEIEGNPDPQTVILDLEITGTVNILYTHNWKLGRHHKFCLNAGYAIPVSDKPYKVKTQGVELTDASETVMRIMQPGGLIIGFEFMFGL